jgi:hypothetical protein
MRPTDPACFLVAVLLAACSNSGQPSGGSAQQQILFEVEQFDHRQGSFWRGFYVAADGRIVAWEQTHAPWRRPDASSYTEAELLEKYAGGRVLGHVPMHSLRARADLIPAASEGRIEPARTLCRVPGGITYRAFLFDEATRRYLPVLLRDEAGQARSNQSTSAIALQRWLAAVDAHNHVTGCTPRKDRTPGRKPHGPPGTNSSAASTGSAPAAPRSDG